MDCINILNLILVMYNQTFIIKYSQQQQKTLSLLNGYILSKKKFIKWLYMHFFKKSSYYIYNTEFKLLG